MLTAFSFETGHADLVHDLAYDYYGSQLATCSSDHKVRVWAWESDAAGWTLKDSWKAHDAPVLRVSWAHPEFGTLFATCSFDKTVRVWEHVPGGAPGGPAPGGAPGTAKWVQRAMINDFRSTVHDVCFAPHHHGLKLATVASDGIVRIYEATNVANTGSWTLVDEFDALETNLATSPSLGSMTALGAPHPLLGGPPAPTGMGMDALFCLSWCDTRQGPPALAVGCGLQNCVKVFRMGAHNRWQAQEVLRHTDVVTDVAWAPTMGRSYQLIATASKDGHVCIFRLADDAAGAGARAGAPPTYANAAGGAAGGAARARADVEMVADFPDHHSEVWRVEWNVTGTLLSSSGDDGKVRVWKTTLLGEWKCLSVVSATDGRPLGSGDSAIAAAAPVVPLALAAGGAANSLEPAGDIPTFFT